MPAMVYFRGVCLYVVEAVGTGKMLRVMMPKADTGEDRRNAAADRRSRAIHYPLLSLFEQDGEHPIQIIDIAGKDLAVMPDRPLRQAHLAGLLSLREAVGPNFHPVQPYTTKNRKTSCTVKVGSGTVRAERDAPSKFILRASHGIGHDQHGVRSLAVSWTAPNHDPVNIVSDGTAIMTVGPNQKAVIGHYDDPADAEAPEIEDLPGDGTEFDADFDWIYDLLHPRAYPRYVPEVEPEGTRDGRSPMTSTCFGGMWP